MPLDFEQRFRSRHWLVEKETRRRLSQQEEKGWYDAQDRLHIGSSKRLGEVVEVLKEVHNGMPSNSRCKLFVRESCLNSQDGEWTPLGKYRQVEFYLSQREGKHRLVYEATWNAPRKHRHERLRGQINRVVSRLFGQEASEGEMLRYTEGLGED